MPICVFIQLKHIDLIEEPIFGFIITETCVLFNISDLIIFRFFIKKIGKKLSLPKGPILLISLIKLKFIAKGEISES